MVVVVVEVVMMMMRRSVRGDGMARLGAFKNCRNGNVGMGGVDARRLTGQIWLW